MLGPENSQRIRKILHIEVWSAVWKRLYVTVSFAKVYFSLIFSSCQGEPPSILWIKWGCPVCAWRQLISVVLPFLSKPLLSHLDEKCWIWPSVFCIVKCLWDSSHDAVLLSPLHAIESRQGSLPTKRTREMSQVKFWWPFSQNHCFPNLCSKHIGALDRWSELPFYDCSILLK